ncbi:hypothetical protein AK812_SmicGene36297 [Symbiodinium microadriaticum]|uniref:Uncharacterized protein n=1 Tax=Symbiodinium microadriaticum TaxID=2951 RepID=A0A1Q9CJC4_SYMMI|nr:hypothetical protein AK812_SmicGene36297 [Symbiodinium microadriaticum]
MPLLLLLFVLVLVLLLPLSSLLAPRPLACLPLPPSSCSFHLLATPASPPVLPLSLPSPPLSSSLNLLLLLLVLVLILIMIIIAITIIIIIIIIIIIMIIIIIIIIIIIMNTILIIIMIVIIVIMITNILVGGQLGLGHTDVDANLRQKCWNPELRITKSAKTVLLLAHVLEGVWSRAFLNVGAPAYCPGGECSFASQPETGGDEMARSAVGLKRHSLDAAGLTSADGLQGLTATDCASFSKAFVLQPQPSCEYANFSSSWVGCTCEVPLPPKLRLADTGASDLPGAKEPDPMEPVPQHSELGS